MEGLTNALSGNKSNLVIIGLVGVVIFLLLRNHKEIKRLKAELSMPMVETVEVEGESA